ncbi:MAG: DUF1971 domain-containing protein [Rhodospirillaceae bacterium]|nr:DUF1971 domain-containing protein [Rhodospirillaceae bacterium]
MAVPYRSTSIFNEKTLPAALRGEHKTKAGVWGVIQVIEGQLGFSLANGEGETILTPDNPGLILPEQTHWVELMGPMQMQVHFYDQRPDDLRAHHRHTDPIAAPATITA